MSIVLLLSMRGTVILAMEQQASQTSSPATSQPGSPKVDASVSCVRPESQASSEGFSDVDTESEGLSDSDEAKESRETRLEKRSARAAAKQAKAASPVTVTEAVAAMGSLKVTTGVIAVKEPNK